MSSLIVNNDEIKYILLGEEINDLVFHIDLIMFKIKGYDKSIDDLISENLDYTFILEELKIASYSFDEISRKLTTRLSEYRDLERKLDVPVNLNYVILLKTLKSSPSRFGK